MNRRLFPSKKVVDFLKTLILYGFICARLRLARVEGLGRSALNNPHLSHTNYHFFNFELTLFRKSFPSLFLKKKA